MIKPHRPSSLTNTCTPNTSGVTRWPLVITSLIAALTLGCTGGTTPNPPTNSQASSSSTASSMVVNSVASLASSSSSSSARSSLISTSSTSVLSSAPTTSSQPSSRSSQASSSSAATSQNQSSSAAKAEPPFSGTVYIDADIFTANDPNSYKSIEYLGRGEREVYDSRSEPKTTQQNVYLFKVLFDDNLSTEIQAVPAFGSEQVAQEEATAMAQALGRIPQQLRQGVKIMTLMEGDGRANASLEKSTIRVYSQGVKPELREELLAHEAAHVALDPVYRTNTDWLNAQQTDINFISTYARDNFGSEDIAESVLPYLAVRYKSERISAANERTISFNNAQRIAFFDRIFTGLHPMVDISQQTKAALTAPAVGKTLTSDSVTFQWQAPTDAQNFDLVVGTTGYGANDLRASNIINTTELTLPVPSDGTPVYARLWTQKENAWRYNDYRFAGFSPNIDAAAIRLPAPGSQFSSSEVTFHWDAPTSADQFDVIIGSQGAGSNDLRASAPFTQSWLTVKNLPENNQPIYVRLWTHKDGWNYQDFEYTASQTTAELLSPKPGTALTQSSATFSWQALAGAGNYDVIIGTNGPGSNNIRASQIINTNTLTVNNLPTDGKKIYVRLWTYKGKWHFIDYTYN